MSFFNQNTDHYWRNFATRSLLVFVTVIVIVWFLPRNEGLQFSYDIGKPWMYGSFIAKFDFPIYKTDEAIKKEKDSIIHAFQPYYHFDNNVERSEIEKFCEEYKNGIPGLPDGYVNLIATKLHEVYETGIMNTPEFNELFKDSTSSIRIIQGNNAIQTPVGRYYSTIAAYERLFLDKDLASKRSIIQKCNLNEYISANMVYDKEKSDAELNDILSTIPIASGMVMSGQKIIDRGDIIDANDYLVLNSFEKEMKRRSATETEITTTVFGQTLFVLILVIIFTVYLALFRQDYFNKARSILMLYVLIAIFPIIVSLMIEHKFFSIYIIPFAMVPIFIRVFMDSRTAFIGTVTMILISAMAVKYQYEFIIVQLIAGLVAIYSLREMSRRAQVFKTAIFVTIASSLVYFSLQLTQTNSINKLDQQIYIYFAINGIFLLLSYPLMYLIEKAFGFVSDVTLFELSNTNKGVLRNLSEIAPGTFQHSITVGNLAAEIANKIGANSLLVRTGALYHDIGKMTNPVFFTENQAGVNPHDRLSHKESAQIIISHVTEGLKLAEKFDLPSMISNFIATHHGTGLAKYFYVQYKNEHPEEEVDKAPFQYPGPNPFTREQALLMMADGVEAASRSLSEYTEESISNLVNKLIDGQVAAGYFLECPITFRDIAQAKAVLIERLKAIYHTRISYPELKKSEKTEEINTEE